MFMSLRKSRSGSDTKDMVTGMIAHPMLWSRLCFRCILFDST